MTRPSQNPLIIPILEILRQADQAMGEHALIGRLKPELELCLQQSRSTQLQLFQTHFLVMNALYQLQAQLLEDAVYLSISALAIEIKTITAGEGRALMADTVQASLRDYYLDWAHFDETSDEDVSSLLNGFWQHYLAQDKQPQAFVVLELEQGAQWSEVQASYRRLVARNHPDRGGSAVDFMAVREAYEVLVRVYGR